MEYIVLAYAGVRVRTGGHSSATANLEVVYSVLRTRLQNREYYAETAVWWEERLLFVWLFISRHAREY